MNNKVKVVFALVILFVLFSFGGVSSLTTLKPAKLSQNYTVLQTCADATYINISISNLGGLITTNTEMVKNGAAWVSYITPNVTGRYDVSYISDGCENSGASYFEVTWTGLPEEEERSRLFWIYGGAILLYLIFALIAWRIELTWLGFIAGLMIILPGMSLMIHGFGFEDQLLIRGIAAVLLIIGMLTMVIFAFEYNHLFGQSGFFGQDNDKEATKDEHDYFETVDE